MNLQRRRLTAMTVTALAGFWIGVRTADAGYTLDRLYRMGDDASETKSNGAAVNSAGTLDSSSDPDQDESLFPLQIHTAVGGTGPTYVQYGGSETRPFAAQTSNNWGVRFDGVDDFMWGYSLNIPSQSIPFQLGSTPGQYAGITDRGYQLWIKPQTLPPAGVEAFVFDDGEQYEFHINSTGAVVAETRNTLFTTQYSAPVGAWTHIAQVRPNGNAGGSLFWVNGRAAASQTGDQVSSGVGMVVGGNAAPAYTPQQITDAANANPPRSLANITSPEPHASIAPTADPSDFRLFNGIIDEIELFVLGTNTSNTNLGAFNYMTDNGYVRDIFLPTQSATYAYLDANADGHNDKTWVSGDINFDGVRNNNDILAFVAGWRSTNAGTYPGGGPRLGDYVTLGKGDFDLDGDTDIDDWTVLRRLFSGSPLLASVQALIAGVPEPGSLGLAGMAMFALAGARRSRSTEPHARRRR